MQTRERWLAGAVGVIAGLWLLDVLAIEPGLAWYRGIQEDTRKTARGVAETRILVDRAERIHAEWRSQHAAGLLDDEDAARFHLQQALAAAAKSSGLTLDSVGGGQRIPAVHGTAYDTIRSAVNGQGDLPGVLTFFAALEEAALPVRIERCELASRDGRKDQVDVALTVSTRIASADARKTRKIPPGQTAWKPAARDGAVDQAVLAGKPFSSDRRSERKAVVATTTASAPVAGGLALVGIVRRPGLTQGFLRNLGDGVERLVVVGDDLDGSKVTALDDAGLHLKSAEGERVVPVGSDLSGQVVASTGSVVPTPTSGDSPKNKKGAASPAPDATPVSDADREAILQRLRQQRNRNR